MRLWLTVGLALALDLASKTLGWISLGGPPDDGGRIVSVIPGWLRLLASRNPGIVFGFSFSEQFGLGSEIGRLVTIALTIATAALIFNVFAASRPNQKWMHLWCGLIMAGAFGNLYDRLVFGFVRDLIQITAHLDLGGRVLDWPYIFNVADVYLVIGVGAVVLAYLFGPKAEPPQPADRRKAA